MRDVAWGVFFFFLYRVPFRIQITSLFCGVYNSDTERWSVVAVFFARLGGIASASLLLVYNFDKQVLF